MDPNTLRYWISVGLRRLPIIIATTVICVIAGFGLLSILSPIYRAAATIVLDPPQIAPDLARSTVPADTLSQVAKIQEEIFVRDNLLELADRFDLYDDQKLKSEADIVDDLRTHIRFEFVNLGAGGDTEGAATFSIAFEHRDPKKATAVVKDLVSVILDENKSGRTGRAGETLAFFEQEVKSLGAKLSKAEAEILSFKNKNINTLPEGLDFRYSQRSSAQERQVQLEREEAGLRSRRETLLSLAAQSGGGVVAPVTGSARDQELFELRRLLDQRLAVFAPTSPSVVDIKNRIAALQRPQPAAPDDAADKEAEQTGSEMSSDFQIQLSDIDGRLEFIEREKALIAQTLKDLQLSIAETPAIETELNRLTRAYESTRALYLAAVERRAAATVGDQIETHLKGERLSLLEPPVEPEKPISPSKRKILLAALGAGFGLGCVIIALLELLDGRVRRPAQIAKRLALEPLATIPYIDAPGERTARRMRALTLGAVGVGATAIALILVHIAIMPLDAVALRVLHSVGLPLTG